MAFVLAAWSTSQEAGFRRSLRLSRDIDALKTRNQKLRADNAALRKDIALIRTDKRAQERVIREELGFVKPDELVMTVEPK